MQVKNIESIASGKHNALIGNVFKILVTFGSLFYLYKKFDDQYLNVQEIILPSFFVYLIILEVGLMVINWLLEIFRWRISVNAFQSMTFTEATVDVLSGLAMNWVLPFTSGDFLSRLASKKDKFKTTSAIILNRLIMLTLTLSFGIYSTLKHPNLDLKLSAWVAIIAFLVITALWLLRPVLSKFLAYFRELTRWQLWQIFTISVFRYVVFVFQFVIILKLVLPETSVDMILAGVGWVFLIRTIFPSILGGLGLREASAYMFFESLIIDPSIVVFAVFTIWLINSLTPSIVGLALIWKLKLKIAK